MASEGTESPSALARERGNKLYKEGNLAEAEKACKEAAKLAPDDPSPLSNISAVLFEKGDYAASLVFVKKAIALSAAEPQDSPKKRRLLSRAVKCHIHGLDPQGVASALEALEASGSDKAATLQDDVAQMQALWASVPDIQVQRKLVLDRLPRYTPNLTGEPEYYADGHDTPEPLIDSGPGGKVAQETDVRLMFCGSGDARNVFTTMISYWLLGQFNNLKPKIHITMLDIKPAALARTLIILDMAQQFAIMKVAKTPGHEHALVNMSYLFSSPFLPPFVVEKLKGQLQSLIKALEEGEALLKFLYIPPDTRRRVLQVLRQWNAPLPLQFRSKWTRAGARGDGKNARPKTGQVGGLDADGKTFDDLMAIFASEDYISRREPALSPLLAAYRKGEPGARDKLEEYLAATWTPNPTFIDVAWEEALEATFVSAPGFPRNGTGQEKGDWIARFKRSCWSDPNSVDVAAALGCGVPTKSPDEWDGAMEALNTFFSSLSLSLIHLGGRITIEMIAGEMGDVMERMRHGVLEHRGLPPATDEEPDPRKFQTSYDRIHMSNVPDYVGGLFTVALHGRPLLREDKASNMRYKVLLNLLMFQTHEMFQAEYLLMPDAQQIKANFAMERRPPRDDTGRLRMMAQGCPPFLADDYIVWEPVAKRSARWPPPLERGALEHFMHAHLLKVALPHPRPAGSPVPVWAPLNLTALLRLAAHMGSRDGAGCPPHWLSGVLAAWCSGTVSTTARAPRQLACEPESARAAHPRADLCVAPWRAELTTLVGLWRPLLPFGIIGAAAAGGKQGMAPEDRRRRRSSSSSAPAPLELIRRYSVKFDGLPTPYVQLGDQLTLVFWDAAGNGTIAPPRHDLRRLLLGDDDDDDGGGDDAKRGGDASAARRTRERGVHVVTTLSLDCKTATARFWLRGDVMEDMRAGTDWRAFLWRASTWERASDGARVAEIADEGGWLDARGE
ncbi:hypothetical protein RB594_009340 [Gaeumannomyces avenae]